MTNRFNALTVVLKNDMPEEEAEELLEAIRQLRGVLSVEGNVADVTTHIAEERAKRYLGKKLIKKMMEVLSPSWAGQE